MQRLRALAAARSSLRRPGFASQEKAFSALPSYTLVDDVQDQVLIEGRANSRAAVLNRPSALNSLTTSMVSRLHRLYKSWEDNSDLGFVMMKGNGRAFCSGSDVVSLYESINEGKFDDCKQFFATLYQLVYLLGTYSKPNVAIMDGITMGCGAGLSLPAMFRVATDRTIFAHPEAHIGFHPDAGASFNLSHLPGYLGEYLALTGEKLNGIEMIACGLATHFSLNARLDLIEERLGKLKTDEASVIDSSLAQYGDLVYPDRSSVLHKIDTIDKCFSHDTVEEIIVALENEAVDSYDQWYSETLKKLKEASPLSLKITLRSIKEGRFQSLDQCLAREYRISLNAISAHVSNDFCEGVRAQLVDKDFAPKWNPPSLAEVSNDMVDCYFSPLDELEELKLPTSQREPFI